MIELDRLVDNIIDHDQMVYTSIKKRLEEGICISKIHDALHQACLKLFPDNKAKKILFGQESGHEEFYQKINILHEAKSAKSIRSYGSLFTEAFLFTEDCLEIRYLNKERKLFIKKLFDGRVRTHVERTESIFSTNEFLDSEYNKFISLLRIVDVSITQNLMSCRFYERLGLLLPTEHVPKKPTSTSKRKVTISQDVFNKRVEEYIQNHPASSFNRQTVKESVNKYFAEYNPDSDKTIKKRADFWSKKSIQFWNREEVQFKEIMDMVLKM